MLNKSGKDKKLAEEIGNWLSKNKLQKKFEYKSITQYWNDVVGDLVASKTTKVSLNQNVLTVVLESSVLKNEIILHREHLISELNSRLKQLKISEIRVY